tara:strand:- start:37 stop:243 length:207 start_codon:yes stop_codon:yes gene_type:complete
MKNTKQNSIKIEVYGGCVTEVTGLPDGWDYEIVDHDHLEEQGATSDKQQATSSPQLQHIYQNQKANDD